MPRMLSPADKHTCELLLLEKINEAILETNGFQANLTTLAPLWVVHHAHALLDAVMIADECLNHFLRLVCTQGAALVPAHCVVVYIDLS